MHSPPSPSNIPKYTRCTRRVTHTDNTNDDDNNKNDNNNHDNDNNTQQTNHDCIGSLTFMSNELKTCNNVVT